MSLPALQPWPWRTALVFLLASLVWFGADLDFNVHAHRDEPNKVRQILEGQHNFHHPLLMLDSVRLITAVTGRDDYDSVMLAGRRAASVYAALAVAMLVLVTGRLYGLAVGVAAGAFLLTSPQFFELAHYFKEDPSLVFGISLSLLAFLHYGEKPTAVRAAMAGAAVAVACSAKYAGFITVPFALYAVAAAKRPRDFFPLLGAFAACLVLINWPAVLSAGTTSQRIGVEAERLAGAETATNRSVPHAAYLEFYWRSSPVLVLLLGLHLVNLARRRFRLRPVEWTMLLLPAVYLVAISSVPNVTQRYFLPVGAIFACLSAAGLSVLRALPAGKAIATAAAVLAIAWQLPAVFAYQRSFASDHQSEVLAFLTQNLPGNAFVLVDEDRALPEPAFSAPRVEQRWVRPGETIESLRASGVTHVVVTQRRYAAVMKGKRRAFGLTEPEVEEVRAFYEELESKGRLLREWQRGLNNYLQASFRVYELPAITP